MLSQNMARDTEMSLLARAQFVESHHFLFHASNFSFILIPNLAIFVSFLGFFSRLHFRFMELKEILYLTNLFHFFTILVLLYYFLTTIFFTACCPPAVIVAKYIPSDNPERSSV